MDILFEACAGLDVHKESVSACVRCIDKAGKVSSVVRKFPTMTEDLLRMGDWMAAQSVKHVAMESTGVYWKPIWNLLEGRFELMLCNARDVKNVPGRKTDTRDCQWLAQLLQHGLLRGSFIPPKPQRELRDLTRHRAQLTGEHTRVANRIAKTLEDANIKLASVASDPLGKSGRLMLQAIIAGESDPKKLAELAQRRLRGQIPQLQKALYGGVSEHHRYMLATLFDHLEYLEGSVARLEQRIDAAMRSESLNEAPQENDALPFDQAVELLAGIPGIQTVTAQSILAEIGTRHGPIPYLRPLGFLGRPVPRQPRKRRQAQKRKDHPRKSLAQAGADPSRLGRQPHQEHLSQRPVPSHRPPSRQETRHRCPRPHPAHHRLPHAFATRSLFRTRP